MHALFGLACIVRHLALKQRKERSKQDKTKPKTPVQPKRAKTEAVETFVKARGEKGRSKRKKEGKEGEESKEEDADRRMKATHTQTHKHTNTQHTTHSLACLLAAFLVSSWQMWKINEQGCKFSSSKVGRVNVERL